MNEASDFTEKSLKSFRTFLARWNGKSAELWDLTSSIKTLRILIRGDAGSQNLLIACIAPVSIKSVHQWFNCQLEVSIDNSDSHNPIYRLHDETSGTEILCGKIEIKENVKLW
jgi:hypothetical protein